MDRCRGITGIVGGVRKPTAGRGSNQYRRRGTTSALSAAEIRERLDAEQIAAAFGPTPVRPGDMSIDALLIRAAHPDPKERRKLTKLKSCPPEVLDILADDEDPYVRGWVADNPRTPAAALRRLAEAGGWGRYPWTYAYSVAKNPSLPPDVAEALVAFAPDIPERERFRRNVFENSACPEHLLRQAAQSEHQDRAAAASNPSLPRDLVDQLAVDESSWVRSRMAANPSCPVDVLVRLSVDGEPGVRSSVAGHRGTPPDVLTGLADDQDRSVRYTLARNPATPSPVLRTLSADPERSVRAGVAKNESTDDQEVFEHLARDPDEWVRQEVAINRKASDHLIELLAADRNTKVMLDAKREMSRRTRKR